MALLLGVDTGGTYTDAVLMRDEQAVIASAKSLTTREDLAIGVGKAVRAVLDDAAVNPADVSMAALSTTLATNALVEGQGGRVALIYIGFGEGDLDRHGLRDALKGDPACVVAGGHGHAGAEAAPLDNAAVEAFIDTVASTVSGWAVAAQFATRNPAHEQAVADLITQKTGQPVTCSHHLSAKLNGPKRAVTAVLNARLIGMIDGLIGRAEDELRTIGLTAPLMVVRGDGALMSAAQARQRPIETILSGPAASIVGARWLTGVQEALVSDIGGTTTDVALLRDGRPALDPAGAQVGGFRTMVEAVAMRTTGLGGDSQVHMSLAGGVTLGPRRVLPVALIADQAPDVVHAALDAALFDRIGAGVRSLGDVLTTRIEQAALTRLIDRGLVQVAGVTPSDAAHVLGRLDVWDTVAAQKALDLMARRRVGSGDRLADGATALAQMIVDQLTHQTAQVLLHAGFAEDEGFDVDPAHLVDHLLLRKGLARHRGLVALDAALNVDVVGLGASALTYYPAVGAMLHTQMILPELGGVANAIGAVVGRIAMRQSGTVTSPAEGQYRVHLADGPKDFSDQADALTHLEHALTQRAVADAQGAGAQDIELHVDRQIKTAQAEAREVFVEAMITVEATGRPRVASEA